MNGKIYCITNLVNGKYYFGQTCQTVNKRFIQHKSDAKRKLQRNSHLGNAIRHYGKDKFTITLMEEGITNQEELNTKEILWIILTTATNNKYGYNISPGGNKPPGVKGVKQSEATKAKHRAQWTDPLYKARMLSISKTPISGQFKKGRPSWNAYSDSFKDEVIRLKNKGMAVKDICKMFAISRSQLWIWSNKNVLNK